MSESRKGINNSFFGITHSEESKSKMSLIALNRIKHPKPGNNVKVTDIIENTITEYKPIRETAKALNTNISTLISREKRGMIKPYKNRYIIEIIR